MLLAPEHNTMSPTKARTQIVQSGDEGTYRGHRDSRSIGFEESIIRQQKRKLKLGDLGEELGMVFLGLIDFQGSVVHLKVGKLKAVSTQTSFVIQQVVLFSIRHGFTLQLPLVPSNTEIKAPKREKKLQ